ncbi:MAG: hypothetical protein HZB53_06885 [Chloroflexi bacterium]|nr:hypothetical protein [Chloroflexota bacterium]
MTINQILPFITSALMGVFAVWVLSKWAQRQAMHNLMWGIGLAMFAIASFSEALLGLAYNDLAFRLWYLCGAVLSAAWIGQGTVFLMLGRVWGLRTLVLLVLGSLVALGILVTTPLDPAHFNPARPVSDQYSTREIGPNDKAPAGATTTQITYQGKQITVVPGLVPLGAPLRLTTPIFNIYGSIALIGGALYSVWQFWRQRQMGNRMVGNLLIAAGAMAIASASTLARLGLGDFLFIGEFVAAVIMFTGFVVSARRDAPAAATAPAHS